MQKTMFCLAFLALSFGYVSEASRKINHASISHAFFSRAEPTEFQEQSELETALLVYGSITAIYGAYWLRLKQ